MKASIDFLKWFRPGGPWVLTAIVPDGRITTTTFRSDQEKQLTDWLEGRIGYENIYFQVNATGEKIITKKTSKSDIIRADWLHVDIDPSADDPEIFEVERQRILKKIKAYSPHPTLIIDSGGGYQAFWRLAQPVEVDDPSETSWADFERYSRQLEADFNGDHCFNVDRIMRLPGSMNVLNKKKRARGRLPKLASVVEARGKSFDLNIFSQAPLLDGGEKGDVGRPTVQLSGNLPRLSEVDELDVHGDVPQQIKMLIVQGLDPDKPDRYRSRSECFWHVICELVRCKIPDDIIASIILDPYFLISGHVLDQKNPQGYVVRQIQRAKENAINPELPNINDNHALVLRGGKVRVMKEVDHPKKGRVMEFIEPGAFEKFLSNEKVEIGVTKDGVPVTMKKGKWWMENPNRRSYEGILFDPEENVPPGYYNLWRGFSCQAVTGRLHERWLEHVFENICASNQEHYDYVIRWCSRLMQTPATQSETAIVMRGKEGTGKNSFVEGLSKMFPEHFFEATNSAQITGNFNSHLWGKVLIHANEAFFAGDKRQEAGLKGLITDENIAVEAKGVDISQEINYMHVIMSSNSDWVVPAGPESRRYMVLDVSDARIQDSSYFYKMKRDLSQGGQSHLLRYLLDFDLAGWNVRKVPITEALLDQRIRSMPKIAQWWMARLDRGYILEPEDGWVHNIEVEHVWQSYIKDMQEQSEHYRSTRIEIGHFLSKVCPAIKRKRIQRGHSKKPHYILPNLLICRQEFDKHMGGPFTWSDLTIDGQHNLTMDAHDDIPF